MKCRLVSQVPQGLPHFRKNQFGFVAQAEQGLGASHLFSGVDDAFPILRHVIAVYGDGEPAFEPTLTLALKHALANDARAG